MKHHWILTAVLAVSSLLATAQEEAKDKAVISAASVDATNDWLMLGDDSTTAGSPVLRRLKVDQAAAIPSFFTNLPNGSFTLNKLGQSSATSGQVPTWNGTVWAAATPSGGSFSSLTGNPTDNAAMSSALSAKAASGTNADITAMTRGCVVVKSTGVESFNPLSADSDAARWTSFLAANTAATSGDTVRTCPGGFLVSSAVTLKANVHYEFGKSRFYLSSGVSSVYYFTISNSDDVTISGGLFDGASVNVGYGCFNVVGTSRRTRILNARFLNWPQGSAGTATLVFQAGGVVTYKHQSALVEGCFFEGNYTSIIAIQEAVSVNACTFSGCGRDIDYWPGGNGMLSATTFSATTATSVKIRDGNNDSHIIISGCKWADIAGTNSLQVDASANNGVTLSNCQFYSNSSTVGYLDISGAGFQMTGGILDAPLKNTASIGGRGSMTDVFIPASNAVMGWTGSNRALIAISGCYTPTGFWAKNDTGITSVTTTYTALDTDKTIFCDATSAAFTVTLPAAASNVGRIYVIQKTDSGGNAVTIDGNASETINGSTTASVSTQWQSYQIQSNGTNWTKIN